ncbi:MAG: diphthine synthase [Candidatus Woesearchaeota archaeon]
MALYMIGLGLSDEKDISIKGYEIIKRCEKVYLETYTSKGCSKERLELFLGKKIITADREIIEQKEDVILDARNYETALLIVGDVFSATTHIDLFLRAKEQRIKVEVVHNASIFTAVGQIGLELYKYGRTVSIPFQNKDIESPIEFIKMNQSIGLHTLVLLDLLPKENKFMGIKEAADYLLSKGLPPNQTAIGCAAIGTERQCIFVSTLGEIKSPKEYPQCFVLPGRLHFVEEKALEFWRTQTPPEFL